MNKVDEYRNHQEQLMNAEAAIGAPPPPPPMIGLPVSLPPIPGVPNPTPGLPIDLTRYTPEQTQSLYASGYLDAGKNTIAINPNFVPGLLHPVLLAEGFREAESKDDAEGQSDLFKSTGGWRKRQSVHQDVEEPGEFAKGFDDNNNEDELPLIRRKTVKIANGLFGDNDVGGKKDKESKIPGGLFDNSDDEQEVRESIKEDK